MHRDYFSSGVIGVALIVSIVIAWAAILLPSHAAALVRANATNSTGIAASIVSNTARKGDRLAVAHSTIERGAHSELTPAGNSVTKVPVGCDVASSKLIRSQNDAVRCITRTETFVKLA